MIIEMSCSYLQMSLIGIRIGKLVEIPILCHSDFSLRKRIVYFCCDLGNYDYIWAIIADEEIDNKWSLLVKNKFGYLEVLWRQK